MRQRHQLRGVGLTGDDRSVVYREKSAGARTEASTSPIGEGLHTKPHRFFRQDKVPDLKHAPLRRRRRRRCDVTGGPRTGWLDQDRGWGSGIVFCQVVEALLRPFFGMELLWCAGREGDGSSQWCSVMRCGAVRYGTVWRIGGGTQLCRWCRAE